MKSKIMCIGIISILLLSVLSLTAIGTKNDVSVKTSNQPDLEIISLDLENLYRQREESKIPYYPNELLVKMEVRNNGAPINPDYRLEETGYHYMKISCHIYVDGEIAMSHYLNDNKWHPKTLVYIIDNETGPWENGEIRTIGYDAFHSGNILYNITDAEEHTVKVEVDVDPYIGWDETPDWFPEYVPVLESNEENNDITINYQIQNSAPSITKQPTLKQKYQGGYRYSVEGIDNENDELFYHWDMDGDGICDPMSNSDDKITQRSYFELTMEYEDAKVKIVDVYGAESEWSDKIEVNSKVTSNPIIDVLEDMLDNFDWPFPMLRVILWALGK